MITNLELINFTIFEELSIDFSSGINVIIGENGTGKTQLLKAAYALAATSAQNKKAVDEDIENIFTEKFKRIFMPEEKKIGKLSRCKESKCSSIKASFLEDKSHDKNIKFDFSTLVKSLKLDVKSEGDLYGMEPIFIPTKEVLSLYRGLVSNPANKSVFEAIFDETYLDLCSQLSASRMEDHEPRMQSFLEDIVNRINGQFEFDEHSITFNSGLYKDYAKSTINTDPTKDGKKYFESTSEDNLSTHMVAEGFRKLGVLHRLIDNSTLVPKKSGPLFWDEPESNMNPKLMKLIVEILLELSRKEQQIILTTHDYILLKWLDLLSTEHDHIQYHILYRDDNNKVKSKSVDRYTLIDKNAIDDTFSDIYDADLRRTLGDF
jgi:predicted ATP-dependent endonuclease of OLD family